MVEVGHEGRSRRGGPLADNAREEARECDNACADAMQLSMSPSSNFSAASLRPAFNILRILRSYILPTMYFSAGISSGSSTMVPKRSNSSLAPGVTEWSAVYDRMKLQTSDQSPMNRSGVIPASIAFDKSSGPRVASHTTVASRSTISPFATIQSQASSPDRRARALADSGHPPSADRPSLSSPRSSTACTDEL